MQKLFFGEWLGGPRRYSEQAHAGLRHRHDGLPITSALALRWLGNFRRAMEATVAAGSDRTAIFAQVRSLALVLVNGTGGPGQAPRAGEQAWREGRWRKRIEERPAARGLVRDRRP